MKPDDELIPTRGSLLMRLKNWDDQESWRDFFDTYWRLIYGTARKAGLTDSEAQDVVQETVITVAKKMRGFHYDPAVGSFKGWLLHVTGWRIVDELRKRLRSSLQVDQRADQTAGLSSVELIADPGTPVLDAIWEAEWRENLKDAAIRRAKRKVAAKDYQLYDLYVVKEWAVKDIVGTLHVSVDQVYQAKHRVSAAIEREVKHLEQEML